MPDKWRIEGHSHAIADTGDYDGHWQLTNGKISLTTKEDADDDEFEKLVAVLNETDFEWQCENCDDKDFHIHMGKGFYDRLYSAAKLALETNDVSGLTEVFNLIPQKL